METSRNVVTRFAPSPTGMMHVGGIRTALYAWLWARKHKGTFILRIEDTDKEREVAGSADHIMEALGWLGIKYDEGPDIGGPHAPYLQSGRLPLYKKYAEILIEKGFAYPDPYTGEELQQFREQADDEKRPFLFRDHRPEQFDVWDDTKPLRFKTPIKSYAWHDVVRGDLSAGAEAVDDFILIKGDGYPTYNFAHIVDDIEMGVTHVMRGEEFISSTPKFLAVYEALEMTPPIFVTLPPILGPDGSKKLSKRDGAKDVLEYRNEGYLPEAIVNFLALLGWNPGTDQEIFTPEQLISSFEIERVQRSGAQLDTKKLDWISREHIRALSHEDQEEWITNYLPENIRSLPACTTELIHSLVPLIVERIEKFADVRVMAEAGELSFFLERPKLEKENLLFKGETSEETARHLQEALAIFKNIAATDWDMEMIKEQLMAYADTLPKRGPALHPIRYALSGRTQSPDPFTISAIIGRDETIGRIEAALAILV